MKKFHVTHLILMVFVIGFTYSCSKQKHIKTEKNYNVLFITVDDLRPQLTCYGDETVVSPNIDKLAENGFLFERAYTQYALCGPSRTSFLTGFYPRNIGVTNLSKHFRESKPEAVTLPELFKNNGYHTCGLFKVYHLVGFDPTLFGNMNDSQSWSDPLWLPTRSAWGPKGDSIYRKSKSECLANGEIGYGNIPRGPALEAPEIPDSLLNDGEMALSAIKKLRNLKDKPFFMALGFYHPHLPFVAPKKYWDLYEEKNIILPDNQYLPESAPPFVGVGSTEIRSYPDIPDEGKFSEELKKRLLHGYLASVSFVDAQIGLVLNELKRLGLDKNTIVVLLGDHGYQIGEHNNWCVKHSNFEIATRVPLIISIPGHGKSGSAVKSFAELVDLYPTIAELCKLTPPNDLDGKSLIPAINNPSKTLFETAISSYSKKGYYGTSLRTANYRFTEWIKDDEAIYELYDHQTDPGENVNRAEDKDYLEIKNKMISILSNEKERRFGYISN